MNTSVRTFYSASIFAVITSAGTFYAASGELAARIRAAFGGHVVKMNAAQDGVR